MKQTEQRSAKQRPAMRPSPTIRWILGILTTLAVAVIGYFAALNAAMAPFYAKQTADANANAIALSATPFPPLTPAPPTPSCAYQGHNDNETIRNLIEEEAIATNTKDMDIMQTIFTSNAIIRDRVSSKTWIGPIERYENDLFRNTDLKEVSHFDILPVGAGIKGDTATYVSGSKGYYRTIGTALFTLFNNPSVSATQHGSDHWTLKKNATGCWSITNFDFNAGAVEFPLP